MAREKRSAESKRTNPPRDASKDDKFLKDWERLSRSGKHDMNVLKEVMMLLIANDAPLPAEWRDHQLKGDARHIRGTSESVMLKETCCGIQVTGRRRR